MPSLDRWPMLALAFGLWLCTAPLLIWLVRGWLGPQRTLALAAAYLLLMVLGCLVLCRQKRHHC